MRSLSSHIDRLKEQVYELAEEAGCSPSVLQGYLAPEEVENALAGVIAELAVADGLIGHHTLEEGNIPMMVNDRMVKDFHFRKEPRMLRRQDVRERFASEEEVIRLERVVSMLQNYETTEDLKNARMYLEDMKTVSPRLNEAIVLSTKYKKGDNELDRVILEAIREVKKFSQAVVDTGRGYGINESIVVSSRQRRAKAGWTRRGAEGRLPKYVYHATRTANLSSIRSKGLIGNRDGEIWVATTRKAAMNHVIGRQFADLQKGGDTVYRVSVIKLKPLRKGLKREALTPEVFIGGNGIYVFKSPTGKARMSAELLKRSWLGVENVDGDEVKEAILERSKVERKRKRSANTLRRIFEKGRELRERAEDGQRLASKDKVWLGAYRELLAAKGNVQEQERIVRDFVRTALGKTGRPSGRDFEDDMEHMKIQSDD